MKFTVFGVTISLKRKTREYDYESGPRSSRESAPTYPLTSMTPQRVDRAVYRAVRRMMDEGLVMGAPRTWDWNTITEAVRVQYPALAQLIGDKNAQR